MGGCVGKGHRDEEEKLNFKGGNVHIITSKDMWDQKIAEANRDGKPVVANFSASWCGPCRVIARIYAEMSRTYPQIMFLTIDVDDLMHANHAYYADNCTNLTVFVIHFQDFSSSWDIRATPTFFFLKDGQQIDKLVGANRPELEKKVEAIANSS
ncbi:hypothetical protein PR202_ga15913 [Eleusine coracana subsp. coracana]|uniref:Thioredoxin domain-containing protein n=1 Tax=Eleusine coracana subsp. coracana TaxID=191504 RepID=A0AAV5CLH9_ELECO|nr:hypothetical protein PR202_ga15913 [Eleusine coracana subsp. coracana]